MTTTREARLGVDIGRVIIGGYRNDGSDTAFFNGDETAMLATPEVRGAIDAIGRLTALFEGNVWLVSKCGPNVQQRTLRWLAAHDFHPRTGVPLDHVRFCRRRADKRLHCLELGLTHFVDDRPDVHDAIRGIVDHQYLFGPQDRPPPSHTTTAADWASAECLIRASLSDTCRRP